MHEVKKSVIMEAAKDLLVSTDQPVEEISRMLNFSSSVYFRKCFKEHFGISPRQMRKDCGI
jgi:AraC-like DNA-binding protein